MMPFGFAAPSVVISVIRGKVGRRCLLACLKEIFSAEAGAISKQNQQLVSTNLELCTQLHEKYIVKQAWGPVLGERQWQVGQVLRRRLQHNPCNKCTIYGVRFDTVVPCTRSLEESKTQSFSVALSNATVSESLRFISSIRCTDCTISLQQDDSSARALQVALWMSCKASLDEWSSPWGGHCDTLVFHLL